MARTILLVDDEVQILDILMDQLSDLGLCLRATDGREALSMARIYRPDLIISDYKMPGLSGLELVRALQDQGFKVPVIYLSWFLVLSAYASPTPIGRNEFISQFKVQRLEDRQNSNSPAWDTVLNQIELRQAWAAPYLFKPKLSFEMTGVENYRKDLFRTLEKTPEFFVLSAILTLKENTACVFGWLYRGPGYDQTIPKKRLAKVLVQLKQTSNKPEVQKFIGDFAKYRMEIAQGDPKTTNAQCTSVYR